MTQSKRYLLSKELYETEEYIDCTGKGVSNWEDATLTLVEAQCLQELVIRTCMEESLPCKVFLKQVDEAGHMDVLQTTHL